MANDVYIPSPGKCEGVQAWERIPECGRRLTELKKQIPSPSIDKKPENTHPVQKLFAKVEAPQPPQDPPIIKPDTSFEDFLKDPKNKSFSEAYKNLAEKQANITPEVTYVAQNNTPDTFDLF